MERIFATDGKFRRGGLAAIFALVVLFASPLALAQCPAHDAAGWGQAIANGHAWASHGAQFQAGVVVNGLAYPPPSINNQAEFATLITSIIQNPDQHANIANGRAKYWLNASGTIVIVNPHANDCGAAFRPDNGITYYNNLN